MSRYLLNLGRKEGSVIKRPKGSMNLKNICLSLLCQGKGYLTLNEINFLSLQQNGYLPYFGFHRKQTLRQSIEFMMSIGKAEETGLSRGEI